jgi:hypothetical protein
MALPFYTGQVPTADDFNALMPKADLSASSGSSLVGFKQAGANTVERTVEDKLQESISVLDYGADPTGINDSYPAFQSALDQARLYVLNSNRGLKIRVPSGTYRFSALASVTLDSSPAPNQGWVYLDIEGDGEAATELVADPTNTQGCLKLLTVKNTHVIRVSNMSFLSDLDQYAVANNGIALEISNTVEPGPENGGIPRWTAVVSNVFFGGYWNNSIAVAHRGNWQYGLRIQNQWFPVIENVRAACGSLETPGTRTAAEAAIYLTGCYSPDFRNIYTQGGWYYGIRCAGIFDKLNDAEDFRLINSFLTGQMIGFTYEHNYTDAGPGYLYEPGGAISNVHTNSRKYGIHLKNHRQVQITNAYMYANDGTRAAADGELLPACILLEGCADIKIDAQFLEPGFYTSDTNAWCAVRLEEGCESVVVGGQFGHGGIGVLNNSTFTARKSIVVKPDIITSRRSAAWAQLVPVVDNAGTAISWLTDQSTGTDRITFATSKTNGVNYANALRLQNNTPGQTHTSALEIAGANADGQIFNVAILRGIMDSAVAGSEDTHVSLFVRKGGDQIEGFKVHPTTADGDSYGHLVCNIGGARVMKNVKVGAPDSGGVGFRALITNN